MSVRLITWLVPGVLLACASTAAADEPLPAPRQVPAPAPQVTIIPAPTIIGYARVNPYDVWQYYDVNQQGRWVPRVVYTPGNGASYLYNGDPYYFSTVNPRYWKPAVMGTPYRSAE